MLYLVRSELGVNCGSWHGEIERYDLTSCSRVMVELRTRKRDMRGHRRNVHENLGHKRISGGSQFTIPDMVGMSPDQVCINIDTRTSQLNQASRTPDFSYPLISSTSLSSSSPSLSFLSTTLPSLQNTKFSHPSLSLYAMSMSWHRVQHTPSTAYTEYSIHRVQHTPSTAYTEYSIHRLEHSTSTAYTEYCIHRVQPTPSTAYTEYSIHRVQHTPSTAYTKYSSHPRSFVFRSFSWLRVNLWMYLQLPACLPTGSTAIRQFSIRV